MKLNSKVWPMRLDGWPSLHPYPRMMQWLSGKDTSQISERRPTPEHARLLRPQDPHEGAPGR